MDSAAEIAIVAATKKLTGSEGRAGVGALRDLVDRRPEDSDLDMVARTTSLSLLVAPLKGPNRSAVGTSPGVAELVVDGTGRLTALGFLTDFPEGARGEV